MRKHRKLGIFGGNDRLLEAIIENSKPLRETETDSEAQREAKRLDEKEAETRWNDERQLGIRGPWMRQNARRKGTIRNHAEQHIINRIGRKG